MSVIDIVQASLADDGPVCMPGLAAHLSRARWKTLADSTGLDRATYGTIRHLNADVHSPREELLRIILPREFAASRSVIVETLRGKVRDRYADLGLEFHSATSIDPATVGHAIERAMALIARVPEAAEAIGSVLAVLHVMRPPGPDYDVSYSDPAVPFSVFVGVSEEKAPLGGMRLAEGILHECMHLQLSLLEDLEPMVSGHDDSLRSPWQGVMRPTQGNLHGLYVFRVLQWFHLRMIAGGGLTDLEQGHSEGRIRTIEEEIRGVRDLVHSRDLTEAGLALVARLLRH